MLSTLKSFIRVARRSRPPMRVPLGLKTSDTCIVLGNGPSLDGDIRNHLGVISAMDSFCVNQFAESDLYATIKPKYYVFADPSYWSPGEPEELVQMREVLYQRIKSETSWDLGIFAPFAARQMLTSIFPQPSNVRLIFYNNVAVAGWGRMINALYRFGLGMPHVQNVLVAAIFLSLRMDYRSIILVGADHSWHQSIALDDNNRVCLMDSHFYHSEAQLKPFGEGRYRMDNLFVAFGRMFEGYWALRRYSDHLGSQIYNASSTTFIDAFDRRGLSGLLRDHEASLTAPGGPSEPVGR